MQWLIERARDPWFILVALVIQLTSFRLLRITGTRFQAITNGHEPFDFQNRLTSNQIYDQLTQYTPDSKALYTRFFLIDFVFPLAASLFLSLLWTVILQHANLSVFEALLRANGPVFAFLPTLFDWGENVCFLFIIQRYPTITPGLAQIAVIFKRLKLITLFATLALTILLVVIGGLLLIKTVLGL